MGYGPKVQSMEIQFDANYKEWLRSLKEDYRKSQIKAAVKVNSELIRFYYRLFKDISERHFESLHGSAFYRKLSKDLKKGIPDASGFSETNLHYMFWFYERYKNLGIDFAALDAYVPFPQHQIVESSHDGKKASHGVPFLNLQQVAVKSVFEENKNNSESQKKNLQQVAVKSPVFDKGARRKTPSQNAQQVAVQLLSLSWGHHQIILGRTKTLEESLFYVHEAFANGWSRAVLSNFIKSDLYARQGQAITNFSQTLPEADSDLAQQLTKDPYDFNFIAIERKYKEKKLKDALINNLESFLLELGNGFAFLGKEVRIQIGDKEKFMDMLFYNMSLHCYVVVEVKVEELDSDNLGQLGLYVTAVNHQLRKEGDAPTIGLLVVSDKNNLFAKYALEMMSVPIGIAEYQLTNFLPDHLRSELPSVKDIEEGIK